MFSQQSCLENSQSAKRRRNDGVSSDLKKTASKGPSDETVDIDIKEACRSNHSGMSELLNSKKLRIDDQRATGDWVDFFAPKNSDELAIHAKKRQELEHWFKHCVLMKQKNSAQLCLLTGPSGSGKTTALRILAKEHNMYIQEWINPVDQDNVYNLGDQTHVFLSSQIDAFKHFLFKASRYRSLFETNKCLLLVEDFPNFILKDPTVFQEILE